MRVGYGFDVHRLVENRKLIIGGVTIPFEKGLEGHSDADVLLHAIMDALLGAAALGDIGQHFPPLDQKFKDADSAKLLKEVHKILSENGYNKIINIDSTIMAEQPKFAPHIISIRQRIAEILRLDLDQVSVKATTTEKLGFTGREEGIAVSAICLIAK